MAVPLAGAFVNKEERVRVKSVNVLDGSGKPGSPRMNTAMCLSLRNPPWSGVLIPVLLLSHLLGTNT